MTCAVQRHKMSVVKTGFSEMKWRKGENRKRIVDKSLISQNAKS